MKFEWLSLAIFLAALSAVPSTGHARAREPGQVSNPVYNYSARYANGVCYITACNASDGMNCHTVETGTAPGGYDIQTCFADAAFYQQHRSDVIE